jgi:ABC-type polysaccharide/polyol phosphate export permease
MMRRKGNDMDAFIQSILFAVLFILFGISFALVNGTLANQSAQIEKIYEILLKERKNP